MAIRAIMNDTINLADDSGCDDDTCPNCGGSKVGDSPFFDQAYDYVHARVWPALYRRALDARLERAHDANIEAVQDAAEADAGAATGKSKGPEFERILNEGISQRMSDVYDAILELDEDPLMEQAIAEASDYFITQPAIEAEIFRLENPGECENV